MTTLRWAWMAGLVASLVAPSAYSQHREAGDVYWGATLGYHLAPDMEGELQRVLDAEYGAGDVSVSVDDGVVGWGVYGGFAVADGLALEAGYLGNTDMEITLWREAGRATAEVDLSSSAFYAAVVANFPMPRGSTMYPFVKAGWLDGRPRHPSSSALSPSPRMMTEQTRSSVSASTCPVSEPEPFAASTWSS